MSDTRDWEIEGAFRPGRRPAWIAVALNVALAAALLGFPYMRGRLRANESADHFVRFATCLYGAAPARTRGLAFPPLDREHFAARATRVDPNWPADCLAHLEQMRPQPVIFLFPTPKRAEEDLRRALDQARTEFEALARTRELGPIGAVPERPLRAIEQLRAALSNLLQASDVPVDPEALAFEFSENDANLVRPSRIPLRTGLGGTFAFRPEAGGLRAVASDGRAVAEVMARDGRVELSQVRRPSAVRGMVLGPERGFLVWTTGEATCVSDPLHCAGRALGLREMPDDETLVTPRFWLSAHPVGRLDRALHLEPGLVWVMSMAADGEGLDVRKFILDPSDLDSNPDGERSPLAASEETSLGRVVDALFTSRGVIWASRREGALHLNGPELASSLVLPMPGQGAPRHVALSQCGGWISVATPEGISLVHRGTAIAPIVRPLREPLLGASNVDDSVRLVCHGESVDVVAIDRRRHVVRFLCDPSGCAEPDSIAAGASQMSAVRGADATIVAWTGDAEHPQIHLARIRGSAVGAPVVPAPCWDSGQGMCGAPHLVVEGERVLLAARENADLMVLEVDSDGFRPLPGL